MYVYLCWGDDMDLEFMGSAQGVPIDLRCWRPPLGPPLPPAAGELAAAAAGSAAAAASSAASLICALGRRSWWSCGDERSWSMYSDRVDDEAEEVGDGLGCLILMFDYSI